jgi:hypothetical protein
MALGSGPPGRAPTDAGGDGGATGIVAGLPGEVDEVGWGPDPPSGDSPEDAVVLAGQVVLVRINKVSIQKLNGTKKSMRRRHSREAVHQPFSPSDRSILPS